MTAASLDIIDFHSHYIDPSWTLTTTRGLTGDRLKLWQRINGRINDERALVKEIADEDLAGRVVNTPAALIAGPDGNLPFDSYRRINDQLAALVSRHNGLHGLASVDAYDGERSARELTRAVKDLGLRGVFVESAKGNLFIDAPEARPTLAAAAALGIPVFVHPVNPEPLTTQLAPYGRLGTLLARGTVNAAALVALIGSGTLEELPGLKVVVTALAIGGILLSSGFGGEDGLERDTRTILRRNVYVDTMGFDPVLIRSAVDVLGVEHVLAGSDWPIVNDGPIKSLVEQALTAAGLDRKDQQKVARLNVLKLIGA